MANNAKNLRRCIACKQHADKSVMIRLVRGADGVFVDEAKTADGRGAWIHADSKCIEYAMRKKLLNAVFKCQIDASIYESLLGLGGAQND